VNVQEYLARDLIAKAVADERSRIIAELTDASRAMLLRPGDERNPPRLVHLTKAIAIVRGET
jgi:hypothetical protein